MDQLLSTPEFYFLLTVAWTLPWKGVALWKAARLSQKPWFIAILIINTFGLLEILYIYFLSRQTWDFKKFQNLLPFKSRSK